MTLVSANYTTPWFTSDIKRLLETTLPNGFYLYWASAAIILHEQMRHHEINSLIYVLQSKLQYAALSSALKFLFAKMFRGTLQRI